MLPESVLLTLYCWLCANLSQSPEGNRVVLWAIQDTGNIWCSTWSMDYFIILILWLLMNLLFWSFIFACWYKECTFGSAWFVLLLTVLLLYPLPDVLLLWPLSGTAVVPTLVATLLSWPLSGLCCGSYEGEHGDQIYVFFVYSVCPSGNLAFGLVLVQEWAWGKRETRQRQISIKYEASMRQVYREQWLSCHFSLSLHEHAMDSMQWSSFLSSFSLYSNFHLWSWFIKTNVNVRSITGQANN